MDGTTSGSLSSTHPARVMASTAHEPKVTTSFDEDQTVQSEATGIPDSAYPDSAPVADEVVWKSSTSPLVSQLPKGIQPNTQISLASSMHGEEPDIQSVDTSLAHSLESDADSGRWVRNSPFGNESLLDQLASVEGLRVGLNHTVKPLKHELIEEATVEEPKVDEAAVSMEKAGDESTAPAADAANSDESKTNNTLADTDTQDNLLDLLSIEAPGESHAPAAEETPAAVPEDDLIDFSSDQHQDVVDPSNPVQEEEEEGENKIDQPGKETALSIPTETREEKYPDPAVEIEESEDALSAFEQELQKAHENSPGLQALQALPGYENVFIEVVSATAGSVDENSEPTPVTDEEAQRMINEIYKMAEEADLEEEQLASISSETITSQALNRIVEEMRMAAEKAKEAVENKRLAKEAKKKKKTEKSKRRSSKQTMEPPQQTIVINKKAPTKRVVKHYTTDYIPKQYSSNKSNTVSFVEEVIEYEFDGVEDDITDFGDSSTITKSVTEDSVQRMISELQSMAEDGETANDTVTSGSATITHEEMERMVTEIRLAQAASESPQPKDLKENEVQQMVTDIKAAAESEDSDTSKELTEQEVQRMIVKMREAAEKADTEEAAEREMQRMVDEMKWAAEEQEQEEAEEREYLERKREQRRLKNQIRKSEERRRSLSRSRSRSKSRTKSRSRSKSRRRSRSRSQSRRRSSHSRRRSSSPWSDSSSSSSSSDSSMDDSWSSGTSSSWSSRSESPTRERMRRAKLKRRKSRAQKRLSKPKINPQEQAIHDRFGYLTGLISKEDLQEIIENEKKRREQRQLLELVSRSDLQGILNRERSRRTSGYEEIPTKKAKKKKKRQSSLVSAKAFDSPTRKHKYDEDKPTMKEKVTKLMPKSFTSSKKKHKTRKEEEEEMFSKMESQHSSVTTLDTSVRKPYSYLFYAMVCIGMTGLILAVVAVVSYTNQQKENAP
ncbi:MAG: hypothetical protein SGBAC_008713 [Bacillariaceae sp.]